MQWKDSWAVEARPVGPLPPSAGEGRLETASIRNLVPAVLWHSHDAAPAVERCPHLVLPLALFLAVRFLTPEQALGCHCAPPSLPFHGSIASHLPPPPRGGDHVLDGHPPSTREAIPHFTRRILHLLHRLVSPVPRMSGNIVVPLEQLAASGDPQRLRPHIFLRNFPQLAPAFLYKTVFPAEHLIDPTKILLTGASVRAGQPQTTLLLCMVTVRGLWPYRAAKFGRASPSVSENILSPPSRDACIH
eukprot:7380581-Prymnesium_polylepis.3